MEKSNPGPQRNAIKRDVSPTAHEQTSYNMLGRLGSENAWTGRIWAISMETLFAPKRVCARVLVPSPYNTVCSDSA